ncbi:MAG: hypothetical protein U0Z17_07150 [Bacteroidales bacterium]
MKNVRILYVEDDLTLSFVTRDNSNGQGILLIRATMVLKLTKE